MTIGTMRMSSFLKMAASVTGSTSATSRKPASPADVDSRSEPLGTSFFSSTATTPLSRVGAALLVIAMAAEP